MSHFDLNFFLPENPRNALITIYLPYPNTYHPESHFVFTPLFRARWTAEKDTWNAFAGIPWQVGGGKGHLERFHGDSVAGGRRGDATWNTFAGIPWQVGGRKRHLERFCRISVPGGKRDETPGTLSQDFRARWEAGKDTWNTFAGKPCQVGSREMLPDTLSRENRDRWTAGKDTWHTFAGIPCQVGGGKGHLERFHGDSVAGGRRERLPGTLSRGYRGRWEAGRDTWNAFAGIPWQVGRGEMLPGTATAGVR